LPSLEVYKTEVDARTKNKANPFQYGSITDHNAVVTTWRLSGVEVPLVVITLNMQFWKWASVRKAMPPKGKVKQPPQHEFVTPTDVRHMEDNLEALLNFKWQKGEKPNVYVKWPVSGCSRPDFVLIQEGLHRKKLTSMEAMEVGERIEYYVKNTQ